MIGSDGIFGCLLAVIAWKDMRTEKIPDRWTAAVLALGVCKTVGSPDGMAGFAGFFFPAMILALAALWKPGSIGGGDVKLMAAGGLYLGIGRATAGFCLGILISGGYAAVLLALGRIRRGSRVPIGPFLCAGLGSALVAGEQILLWFMQM